MLLALIPPTGMVDISRTASGKLAHLLFQPSRSPQHMRDAGGFCIRLLSESLGAWEIGIQ